MGGGVGRRTGNGEGELRSEEQQPKPVRWKRVRSTEIRRQPESGSKRKTLIPPLPIPPLPPHSHPPLSASSSFVQCLN